MAEIQYTHSYDGCFKIIVLIGSLFIALFPAILADDLMMRIFGYDSAIKTIVSIIVWFIVGMGLIMLIVRYLGYLPDYLYFRLSLGIPISYAESKRYSFLLVPDERGCWVSLANIKSLPKEQRKKVLHAVAYAVQEERGRNKQK